MKRRAPATIAALLLFSCATALAADIPYLTGRVVDNAEILSDGARARLTNVLKAHEDATGNQIVVLTVPTIQPQSIEEYAVKVFESWKLGHRDKDNGVLVVVVPQDRKMRIEVGYGLEPVLTDGTCGQIIRAQMTPAFKQGNYDQGIENGVAAIVARLEGLEGPAEAPAGTPAADTSTNGFEAVDMPWPQRIFMSVFIFGILGIFTVVGVMTPGMGWFLYLFLIPFWSMFPIVIVGGRPTLALLATYLIGYPIAKLRVKHTKWYEKAARDLKRKGRASIGGFSFSTAGSGYSSGGGDSFSGGGGSSGGGGASGSW